MQTAKGSMIVDLGQVEKDEERKWLKNGLVGWNV